MSTLPSVSRQISSAVVRRWISGLAGFANCCGMKSRVLLAISSAARSRRPCPRRRGSASARRRRPRSSMPALDAHRLGHREHAAVARGRRRRRRARCRCCRWSAPARWCPARSGRPPRAASIIETPMRSFTLRAGLKNSSFATTSATASGRRLMRTSGVLPISSVMSLAMRSVMQRPSTLELAHRRSCLGNSGACRASRSPAGPNSLRVRPLSASDRDSGTAGVPGRGECPDRVVDPGR